MRQRSHNLSSEQIVRLKGSVGQSRVNICTEYISYYVVCLAKAERSPRVAQSESIIKLGSLILNRHKVWHLNTQLISRVRKRPLERDQRIGSKYHLTNGNEILQKSKFDIFKVIKQAKKKSSLQPSGETCVLRRMSYNIGNKQIPNPVFIKS